MNKVFLTGRLTADPVIKDVNGKANVVFTLAITRPFKDKDGNTKSDFIRCVAWGNIATTIGKYLKKGYPATVTGSWRSDSYVNQSGVTVYTNDCYVEQFEFALQNPKPKAEPSLMEQVKAQSDQPFFRF